VDSPHVLAAVDILWLPLAGAAFGIGFLIEYLRRRHVEAELHETDRKLTKERERLTAAEHEISAERARQAPLAEAHDQLLGALARSFQEMAAARDRQALLQALAEAVERTVGPTQFMVFSAADRSGREFRLVAAGGSRGAAWTPGALLNDTMGRVGLVARRRFAMDRRQFESEPPLVREQLAQTEPPDFSVDVAVPVVVSGAVAAIVSVGGTAVQLDAARGGLELLASHAASLLRALDAAARIERLKNTDEMTGLGSKSWLVAEGAEALYRCRSEDRPAALAVLGIDDFRGYVTRHGHAAGDRLLKGVAETLRPVGGESVLLARWSGAEFVALAPGVTPAEALGLADRMRAAVAGKDWVGGDTQPKGRLTMSAGVATLPANGSNLDALIEAAVEALAEARWNGDSSQPAPAKPVFGEDVTKELTVTTVTESVPDTKT
jgi:diguanylate cyclase (GGDEF)-like protein